jgi:hypothetical protein
VCPAQAAPDLTLETARRSGRGIVVGSPRNIARQLQEEQMSRRIPVLCVLFSCLHACGAPADLANESTSEGTEQVDESSSAIILPPPPKFGGKLKARPVGLTGCAPNFQIVLDVKNVGLGPSDEKLSIYLQAEGSYFNSICRTTERGTQCKFDEESYWISGQTSYPETRVVVPPGATQYVYLPVSVYLAPYVSRLSFTASATSAYTTMEQYDFRSWVRTDPSLNTNGSNPSRVCL